MIKCANHPERDAVGTCADCGREICIMCRTVMKDKFYCPSCTYRILNGPVQRIDISGQGVLATNTPTQEALASQQKLEAQGLIMQRRNPLMVFFLSLITFGIYELVWFVEAKREMNSQGARIPTAWLIIIPVVSIWWLDRFGAGVKMVTEGRMGSLVAAALIYFLGPIGIAIVQNSLNKSTNYKNA